MRTVNAQPKLEWTPPRRFVSIEKGSQRRPLRSGLPAGPIKLAISDRLINHDFVRVPSGHRSAHLGATSAPIGIDRSGNRSRGLF